MVAALRVLFAAAWLLSGIAAALAQGYPAKPVRVVVGFPAGGPTDAIARIVAQKLTDNLGQQFFVENIGGAGGNIAAGQVAPKEIVDLLYREIAKIVAQPDVKDRLTVLGFNPVANTPDQFAERIKLEMDKWGKVVRDAKLRIE